MKNNEKFTEKAESAIEQARLAAYSLGHSYVGTEHLLIGIVHEGAGLGARILRERGVSERRLREIISDATGSVRPVRRRRGLQSTHGQRLKRRRVMLPSSVTAMSARSTFCSAYSASRSAAVQRRS